MKYTRRTECSQPDTTLTLGRHAICLFLLPPSSYCIILHKEKETEAVVLVTCEGPGFVGWMDEARVPCDLSLLVGPGDALL